MLLSGSARLRPIYRNTDVTNVVNGADVIGESNVNTVSVCLLDEAIDLWP
jgi:hypothetical protein